MSELRWNPLLREWIITAVHRQDRPVLQDCPFCAGTEGVPEGVGAVAVPNRYPALTHPPPRPYIGGSSSQQVEPSDGSCEVLVYTSSHDTALAYLPLESVQDIIRLWRERFLDLERRPHVKYVLIFENRGKDVGVTLSHPHGQLYAFPFTPPIIRKELESMQVHSQSGSTCLLCEIVELELAEGGRVIATEGSLLAYVPFWARWPYEVQIVSERHLSALDEMKEDESLALASLLRRVLQKYDNLVDDEMPYVMVLHQRPVDGGKYSYYHFHIEIYPMRRSRTELKYLAGCELGAGVFLNDSHPEERADELRRVAPD
ncbi:MAG: galactose-1-phosphate uridylyltransferase [Thermoplasmata archaeon]